ncbi:1585_t:CDS:2, partial [Funneliformis geosporum]
QENSSLKEKLAQLEKIGTTDSVYIFIDNSNVYVQGKKEIAWREPVKENLVQIDYGKLVETVQDGRHMGAVPIVVGSRPPPEDTLWKYLRKELGYNVFTYNRNFLNREKEVDSEVSIRVCNTIAKYVPGTVILIAGDGDYGPVMREALDSDWTIEVWFWTEGLLKRLKKMDVGHPEYKEAFALRTIIINLDVYYKKFMFARGYNNNAGMKYLQIFTDLVKDSDIMECYIAMDLFGWWYRPDPNTLKLYVRTYHQWEEIKNLITHKYPNAKEVG